MITDREIPLTKHAFMRMKENGLDERETVKLWKSSKEVQVPLNHVMGKFLKHGVNYLHGIKYFMSNNILFTVGVREPQKPVIVTITKQK